MISRHASCCSISVGGEGGGGMDGWMDGWIDGWMGRMQRKWRGLTDGERQIDKEKQGPSAFSVLLDSLQIGLGATSDPGNYPLPACSE